MGGPQPRATAQPLVPAGASLRCHVQVATGGTEARARHPAGSPRPDRTRSFHAGAAARTRASPASPAPVPPAPRSRVTDALPTQSPHKPRGAGETFSPSPPSLGCVCACTCVCMCVHVHACHVKIALPAAFATSAVVTFWALGLTLKVTAGPRTLEEIVPKGVRAASAGAWAQHGPDACTRPTCDLRQDSVSPTCTQGRPHA